MITAILLAKQGKCVPSIMTSKKMSTKLINGQSVGEVMIVDDNPVDLKLMSDILTSAGYRVRPAVDGELALRSARAKPPELILLDVNLPGQNGIEICRQLKAEDTTKGLPIIFISAHVNSDLKVKALEAGGTDFVTKPFDRAEVLARINTHLHMHRLQRELARQIDERREAQQQVARYSRVFEDSLNEIYIIDSESLRFLEVNKGAQMNLGYTLDELRRMTPFDLKPEHTAETFAELIAPLRTGSRPKITFLTTHQRQDGSDYPVEVHLQYMPGEPNVFAAIILDITERNQAEKDLQESHDIINSSPAVAFLWANTEGWPVDHVSVNVADLLGYTAEDFMLGRIAYADLIHSDDLERCTCEVETYSQDPDTSDFIHDPYRVITKNGETRWLDDRTSICRNEDGEITHYRGVILDITDRIQAVDERKQLENNLYQSDKMASIGQLAAGVAHEINNPIGFILSNLNTMKDYLGELREHVAASDEVEEMLTDFGDAIAESTEGANRVKDIVADMKGFSRSDGSEMALTDINAGLESTLNIVWNQLKYKCKVEKDLGDLPGVECFANRINQVFLNLLVNAGQAIEGEQGLIKIKTWSEGESVHVSIADNGCGIADKDIPRLFEAFYTTKEIGEGTGLGLSLSHDIVAKHGGHITVRSELDVGTEFEIVLPASFSAATVLIPFD